jgi:hypothetical protein
MKTSLWRIPISPLVGFFCISLLYACVSPNVIVEEQGIPSKPEPRLATAITSSDKPFEFLLKWDARGDTSLSVKSDEQVLPPVTTPKPDLTPIQRAQGSFHFVAIGDGLAAGVRDGGYFREGQLTSFPNLIARQMGVAFQQPLFELNEGNGSGYKVLTTTNPVPTYRLVANQLGINQAAPVDKFKRVKGKIDNLAFPFMLRDGAGVMVHKDGSTGTRSPDYDWYLSFLRIAETNGSSEPNEFNLRNWYANRQDCDFFVMNLGYDDVYQGLMRGAFANGGISGFPGESALNTGEIHLMNNFGQLKAKGVVATVPEICEFPFFKQYSFEKLKKIYPNAQVTVRLVDSDKIRYVNADPEKDLLLPTPEVEKMFRGENGFVIGERDIISYKSPRGGNEYLPTVEGYNKTKIRITADKWGFAVVDLYSIYKKIIQGNYVTDDGVKVDATFPEGNFFSSDGVYPTAFGQAVIANEYIKAANQQYTINIPLVQTRVFLKR